MRTAFLLVLVLYCVVASADELRPLLTAQKAGPNLIQAAWSQITPQGNSPARLPLSVDNGLQAPAAAGFSQTLHLNQQRPIPILASVDSRATDAGGASDSDYSLYLDIVYADGTPLWAQHAVFHTGTSSWQTRQVLVSPERPIRDVNVYLLFRRHTGKAEFRQPFLAQVGALDSAQLNAPNVAVFDGLLVRHSALTRPQVLIRDVAAGSGFHTASNGEALQLRVEVEPSGEMQNLTLRDLSGHDRALTVIYTIPIAAGNWQWLRDPISTEAPKAHQDMLNALSCAAGARGLLSPYPFAAVADGSPGPRPGQGLAVDLARPAVFRLGFSTDARELYAAFDIALTPEKPEAQVGVLPFGFDGRGGFRAALQKYYDLSPDAFIVRAKHQGLWMPFGPISKVTNWQDFGFAFKEGNDETKWDDAHDILTFRYTEPLTWWMPLPKDAPRTMAAAVARAKEMADANKPDAQALFTSGYHNAAGELTGRFEKQPWCDGIVWSMNSAPGITRQPSHFSTKWNPTLRDNLYGAGAGAKSRGHLDGEYIDSSEGYVTDELNFNREHFAAMKTPLAFDPITHAPAIFRGLIVFEYIRGIATDVHAMDRLMMANATPEALPWLVPLLDVAGTETDWNRGGKWQPMSIEKLLYRRAMCGGKPYCFLMNTNFDVFPPELVEKYMQRCMAFGMFPGFFSHNAAEKQYFQNPSLYNRDRPLFQKYVPLCRMLAEAGWKPVTGAASSNASVHLERFGDHHLTVLNTSAQRQSVVITLAQATPPSQCVVLPASRSLAVRDSEVELELGGEEAVVLDIR